MTVKKYYIGGMGPHLYDDTVSILDPDGDFPGETQSGILTDGPIKTTHTATEDDDLVRKADIDGGIEPTLLTSSDNLNDIDDGWYKWGSDAPTNNPATYCICFQVNDSVQNIQCVIGTSTNQIFVRRKNSGTFSAWATFWNSTNDGTGSGLDADLLDGQTGAYYAAQIHMTQAEGDIDDLEALHAAGASGSFTTVDSKTVTVTNGIITAIA